MLRLRYAFIGIIFILLTLFSFSGVFGAALVAEINNSTNWEMHVHKKIWKNANGDVVKTVNISPHWVVAAKSTGSKGFTIPEGAKDNEFKYYYKTTVDTIHCSVSMYNVDVCSSPIGMYYDAGGDTLYTGYDSDGPESPFFCTSEFVYDSLSGQISCSNPPGSYTPVLGGTLRECIKVPSMSMIGLIILAVLMVILGVFVIYRRKNVFAGEYS